MLQIVLGFGCGDNIQLVKKVKNAVEQTRTTSDAAPNTTQDAAQFVARSATRSATHGTTQSAAHGTVRGANREATCRAVQALGEPDFTVRGPRLREKPSARGTVLVLQLLASLFMLYLFTSCIAFAVSHTMTTYNLVQGHQPLMWPFIMLTEVVRMVLPLDTLASGILLFMLSVILFILTKPYIRIARWYGYRHGQQDAVLHFLAQNIGAKIHMSRRLNNSADDAANAELEYFTVTNDGTYTRIGGEAPEQTHNNLPTHAVVTFTAATSQYSLYLDASL